MKEYQTIFEFYADYALSVGEGSMPPPKPKCTLSKFFEILEDTGEMEKDALKNFFIQDHLKANNDFFPKKLNSEEIFELMSKAFSNGIISFFIQQVDKNKTTYLIVTLTIWDKNNYTTEDIILKDYQIKKGFKVVEETPNLPEFNEKDNPDEYDGNNFDC